MAGNKGPGQRLQIGQPLDTTNPLPSSAQRPKNGQTQNLP